MNLLVTGATGFIGSAFVRLALARGHRVGALVRPRESLEAQDHLVWFPGTIAEPPWDAIARFAPDACVHAAWIATPGVYLESPENTDWLRWSLDFVRRARDSAGVRRFLILGTCIEYAIDPDCREPLSETHTPIAPTSFYARCKNALRVALEEERSRTSSTEFDLCWGRVFYPYGPGEHPDRLCSTLRRKLRAGETITLRTPDSTKDYIFIDDLAAALLLLVEKRATGAINLGTGTGTTVRAIAAAIAASVGRPDLVEASSPLPAVADPLGYVVADVAKLHALGWQPQTAFEVGLERLNEQNQRRVAPLR